MTTQTEALKMALEALKDNQHLVADNERHAYVMEYNSIIEKCEEVLAQQSNEQVEPVAWLVQGLSNNKLISHQLFFTLDEARKLASAFVQNYPTVNIKPLYTHPPVPTAQPKEPEQEPVAHFGSAYVNENGVHITTVLGPVAIPQDAKLYTTPPQRKKD